MNRSRLFAALVVPVVVLTFLADTSSLEAQILGRRIRGHHYQNNGYAGPVVNAPCYQPKGYAATPPVVSKVNRPPAKRSNPDCETHQDSDCDCDSDCVENPGNCDLVIRRGTLDETITTEEIKVDPPTDCDCKTVKIDFYEDKEECVATIMVPKKIVKCEEKYLFERKTFDICGCELEICIPCKRKITKTVTCEEAKSKETLVARIRTGNSVPKRADIWVYDVKGYPSKAVLALNITSADANRKFGTTFRY